MKYRLFAAFIACLMVLSLISCGGAYDWSEKPISDPEASEKDTDKESDEKPDKDSDEKPDKDSDEKPDKESDEKPNKDSDEKPDKESDEKPDKESDEKPDKESDEKPNKDSDEKPDKDSDEKPDKDSDEKLDKDSDEKPDKQPDENQEQNVILRECAVSAKGAYVHVISDEEPAGNTILAVINSKEELNAFLQECKNNFTTDILAYICDDYDASTFENSTLLIYRAVGSSCCLPWFPKAALAHGENGAQWLQLYVDRTHDGIFHSADENDVLYVIEVKTTQTIDGTEDVKLKYIDMEGDGSQVEIYYMVP